MALVTLRILDGADRGRIYEKLPTPITIGREEGNSVQLNDERVSRFHLKIQEDQERLVLTDLDSTNGTRVNGEDTHLRILRYGDMIMAGRSVLLFGSPEQIAARLASLREAEDDSVGTVSNRSTGDSPLSHSLEFELRLSDANIRGDELPHGLLQTLSAPELPERLTPCQAAQLSELIEYLHLRIRHLLESVCGEANGDRVTLEQRHWQGVLDLQARLALYLRSIGRPQD